VQHFAHEEQFFRMHGYPGAAAHQAEHLKLTDQAKALKQQFETDQTRVTLDTLKFLRDWLNNHIIGSDKQYMEFLLAKGVT
jgi:hemerythrin-like metal-binding protein